MKYLKIEFLDGNKRYFGEAELRQASDGEVLPTPDLIVVKQADRPSKNDFLRKTQDKGLRIGKYFFNAENRTLSFKRETLQLTERETYILRDLNERRGSVVLRDQILKTYWGINDYFTSRSLDVFVRSLRKKLSQDPDVCIETVRGKGLKLSVS